MVKWTKEKFLRLYDSDLSNEDLIMSIRKYFNFAARECGRPRCTFSDDQILSIAYRLYLLIKNSGSSLAAQTNKTNNYIRESIIREDKESYARMPIGESVIDISFGDCRTETYLLDDNGDVFLRDIKKIKSPNHNIDTYGVSTYCLSDCSLLTKVSYPRLNREYVDMDKIENAIVCDRFDPVDQMSFNGYLRSKEMEHKNNFRVLDGVKSSEELDLIRHYYGEVVPVPHFHFGTKSYLINNRGGQLAISLRNLSNYLNDLMTEFSKSESGLKGDYKLLKHDIGIPFYEFMNHKMAFDAQKFYDDMKNLLYRLSCGVNGDKKECIRDFYKRLKMSYMSASSMGETSPVFSLSMITDVVDLVDYISPEISPKDQVKIINKLQECCVSESSLFAKQEMHNDDVPNNDCY